MFEGVVQLSELLKWQKTKQGQIDYALEFCSTHYPIEYESKHCLRKILEANSKGPAVFNIPAEATQS